MTEKKNLGSGPRPHIAELGLAETSADGVDPALIDQEMKRNRFRFEYCYEKELVHSPDLHGKVIAKFTIRGDGTVAESTASGVHVEVDTCVAEKIKTLRFPKPKARRPSRVTLPIEFTWPY